MQLTKIVSLAFLGLLAPALTSAAPATGFQECFCPAKHCAFTLTIRIRFFLIVFPFSDDGACTAASLAVGCVTETY